MPPHGTWEQTGGGGDGNGGAVAVLVLFIIAGVSGAAGAVEGALVIAAVVAGVLIAAVAVVLGWWLLRVRPAREARALAARLERQQAWQIEDDRRAALRHQRALELAQASAPVIQNLIAPGSLSQPVPRVVPVMRGEVES